MSKDNINERRYLGTESVVFRKTKELYGGLSNMAAGFPITVNGITIPTSEALYQACRFPHLPDVQERILKEKSPMSAKMVSKPFRNQSRKDWDNVRVNIMRWCLRIKLAQHFIDFGKLLESTFNKPIVEDSTRDDFWGAIRDKKDDNILSGGNVLGRLLMELRQRYNAERYSPMLLYVEPLNIQDFRLLGEQIQIVDEREHFIRYLSQKFGCTIKLSWNGVESMSYSEGTTLPIKDSAQFLPKVIKTESIIIPTQQRKHAQSIPQKMQKRMNTVESEIPLFK